MRACVFVAESRGALVKLLLAVIAGLVALAGFGNFFASLNGQSPIPIGISHPLAMVAMAYLLFQHIFPATIYRAGSQARTLATQTLETTGTPLAQTTCGGSIGRLQFRGPLLRVAIYPGGILLKPLFMPAAALLNHEITAIHLQKMWFSEVVEITHRAQSLASPIRLACGSDDPIRAILLTRGQPDSGSA
jgi:hypothetical protein